MTGYRHAGARTSGASKTARGKRAVLLRGRVSAIRAICAPICPCPCPCPSRFHAARRVCRPAHSVAARRAPAGAAAPRGPGAAVAPAGDAAARPWRVRPRAVPGLPAAAGPVPSAARPRVARARRPAAEAAQCALPRAPSARPEGAGATPTAPRAAVAGPLQAPGAPPARVRAAAPPAPRVPVRAWAAPHEPLRSADAAQGWGQPRATGTPRAVVLHAPVQARGCLGPGHAEVTE